MAKPKRTRADDPSAWDSEVASDIWSVHNILKTGVLNSYHHGDLASQTFARCAFTQLMIDLKDLLVKADREGMRLNAKIPGGQLDVTDMVVKLRDAICHTESPDSRLGKSKMTFESQTLPNGDMAYSYGGLTVGLKWLVGVFSDVRSRLMPLTNLPPDMFK